MTSSKLFKNTTIYTVGMIFPKIGQFILLPIYTKYLSPSDYGILNNVQVINSILFIIYTLALNRAIFRLYFDFKTEHDKRDYLGTIAIGLTISTISVSSVFFIFPDVLGSVYKSISFYPYFSLSVLASAITSFFLVPKTSYFVKEKATVFVILSIVEFIVRNGMIVLFVVYFNEGVVGYLKGQLYGNLLLLPLFLFLTYKNVNFVFVKSTFIKSLQFSLPLLPMTLSAWVMNMSDRIFIERYFDTHDVGIYSLGYKISMLIVIFSDSFYSAYNPYYFKTASKNKREVALSKLKKTNTIYLLIVILFCSIIALFAKEGITLLFDERYLEAYKIIAIVSLSYMIGKATGIFNLAIYQDKKTSFLLIVNITGAAINIGLNFLLIKRFGAFGAAWATVITYAITYTISYFYASKCFYASFNKSIIIPTTIILIMINVVFYYSDMNILYSIVVKTLTMGLFAVFLWFKYRNEIIKIIKK